MEMCLVCLVSLPFLSIHTSGLQSNILRGACSGITSGYLFKNSLFRIMKCARAIPEVHATFNSLYALDLVTEPGTCVQLSIGTPC